MMSRFLEFAQALTRGQDMTCLLEQMCALSSTGIENSQMCCAKQAHLSHNRNESSDQIPRQTLETYKIKAILSAMCIFAE